MYNYASFNYTMVSKCSMAPFTRCLDVLQRSFDIRIILGKCGVKASWIKQFLDPLKVAPKLLGFCKDD